MPTHAFMNHLVQSNRYNERPHFGHLVWPSPVHSSDFQAGYNGTLRGRFALRRLTRKTTYGDDDDGHTTSDLPRSVVSDVYGRWLVRMPHSLCDEWKTRDQEAPRNFVTYSSDSGHIDSEQFCLRTISCIVMTRQFSYRG